MVTNRILIFQLIQNCPSGQGHLANIMAVQQWVAYLSARATWSVVRFLLWIVYVIIWYSQHSYLGPQLSFCAEVAQVCFVHIYRHTALSRKMKNVASILVYLFFTKGETWIYMAFHSLYLFHLIHQHFVHKTSYFLFEVFFEVVASTLHQ